MAANPHEATANPTGEKGIGGVLKESERKSAFDPKKPGMFPGDYKIQKLQIISPIRGENKPILLSIGYASCHWCHVMAHESFEDDETAKIMNDKFINIKLDREERPDIDSIYQTALALLGQQGGWPLTMFLDSSKKPFWGGTYFPKTPRQGMPSFQSILNMVSE